jgi:hypothetical protein
MSFFNGCKYKKIYVFLIINIDNKYWYACI